MIIEVILPILFLFAVLVEYTLRRVGRSVMTKADQEETTPSEEPVKHA